MNPYAQMTAPDENVGNPYASFTRAPTVDEKGQDVINRVNDPKKETPIFFGITEIPEGASKGFEANIRTSTRGMLAGQALQLGEYLPELADTPIPEGMTEKETARSQAARDYFSSMSKALIETSDRLFEKNKEDISKLGLTRPESLLGGGAYDVGGAFGSFLPTIGATVLTRNPIYATAYFAALQDSETYQEARNAGLSPEDARIRAATTAAGTSAIEQVGGHFFLNALKESPLTKKIIAKALGQGAEEAAQTAVEETTLSDIRLKSFEEITANVAYNFLIGSLAAAPITTVTSALENKAMAMGMPEDKAKEMVGNLVDNKEELLGAATDLMNKEIQGMTNDRPAKFKTLEAVKALFTAKEQDEALLAVGPTQDAATAAKMILADSKYTDEQKANVRQAMDGELTMESLQRAVALEVKTPSISSDVINKAIPVVENIGSSFSGIRRIPINQIAFSMPESAIIPESASSSGPIEVNTDERGKFVVTDGNHRLAAAKQRGEQFIEAAYFSEENANMSTGELLAKIDAMRESQIAETVRLSSGGLPPNKADFYNGFLSSPKRKKEGVSVGDAMGKALSPISTRLRNINPKLEARLRKFEQAKNLRVNESQQAALPFLEAFSKLPTNERLIFNAALMNGDMEIINQIAKKHKIDMQPLRDMLNGLYERAKSVELDIGYRENYFPRTVIDSRGLLKYFEKTEAWSEIKEALRIKELEVGRMLTVDEKAHMINTLLRGYSTSQITLSKPSALKERSIDQITPEIIGFYDTSDQSILKYITSVNEAIEVRKFFGKGETTEDSIGAFVLGEIEAGNLNAAQAQELSDILRARFTDKAMNPILKAYKNISYIDTMGSFISAITQIGDISWSLANNGIYNTLSTLPKSISGKTEVTLEEIGVEGIAQEFMDSGMTGNAVRKVFKLVGLQKMDTIGKLTYIESALKRLRAGAEKPTPKFTKALNDIFGDETSQVITDLKNGVNSENVKMLLFNELSNVQPISLAEMPEMYLKHPNGRIFYMLKTFTIKQLDIYRRQIFNEIRDGDTKEGLKNLVRLAFFMSLMNTGADYLKDLLLNRDTPPEDEVVNNIARLVGFSKYQVYSVRREGLGSAAFKTIAPPFKLIDSTSKDMLKAARDGEVDINDLETIGSIPVAGKFYYWWFGAGADK